MNMFKLGYAFWQEGRKTCYKCRRKQGDGRGTDCQRNIQAVGGVPNGCTALELSGPSLKLQLCVV